MTTTTALPAVKPDGRSGEKAVRLVCVSVNAWHPDLPDGYVMLKRDELADSLHVLEQWRGIDAAVWLELAIRDDPDCWFEGISDPWQRAPTPEIDWSEAEPWLRALGVIPGTIREIGHKSSAQHRLVALLPHLYALGVARIRREVLARDALTPRKRKNSGLLFFPTVGFQPAEKCKDFWTVRMCVGVVGNTVITIRLPDLLCTGDHKAAPKYRPGVEDDLPIPRRYLAGRFPDLGNGPTATDVAEAIAIHHAATARFVAEESRNLLSAVEARAGLESGAAERRAALHDLEQIAERANRIDRQLSRELRRLTDYGDCEEPVAAHARVRYGFALDEIRSLRTELTAARAAIVGDIQAKDQGDREKFQFIVALLGAAILFPTLVAAIYGANVNVPGENTWKGFTALLLFVASFAVLGLLSAHTLWTGRWIRKQKWLLARRTRQMAGVLGFAMLGVALAIVLGA